MYSSAINFLIFYTSPFILSVVLLCKQTCVLGLLLLHQKALSFIRRCFKQCLPVLAEAKHLEIVIRCLLVFRLCAIILMWLPLEASRYHRLRKCCLAILLVNKLRLENIHINSLMGINCSNCI